MKISLNVVGVRALSTIYSQSTHFLSISSRSTLTDILHDCYINVARGSSARLESRSSVNVSQTLRGDLSWITSGYQGEEEEDRIRKRRPVVNQIERRRLYT